MVFILVNGFKHNIIYVKNLFDLMIELQKYVNLCLFFLHLFFYFLVFLNFLLPSFEQFLVECSSFFQLQLSFLCVFFAFIWNPLWVFQQFSHLGLYFLHVCFLFLDAVAAPSALYFRWITNSFNLPYFKHLLDLVRKWYIFHNFKFFKPNFYFSVLKCGLKWLYILHYNNKIPIP